ncbi:MAG: transcription-repair coupling factor [Anaerolineaceae bacterium]
MAKSHENSLTRMIKSLPPYTDLLNAIKAGDFSTQSRKGLGLPRAARLALLAALHEDTQVPILLLTNRSDRALSLYDELGFWLPQEVNHYFPEPNPLFYEELPWSQSTRLDRLRVFTNLSHYLLPGLDKPANPPVIIAPIRALMTRTVPRRTFLKNTLKIKVGERQDFHEISAHLVGIGYEYSNIVVQPGQFSRRGGILDVWSPSENLPLRLDFFGDEIDSLRLFDPGTQRSEEKLEQALIFPASEAIPIVAMKDGELPYKLSEHDIPEIYQFPSSLIDFLPDNALILLDGEEFIAAAANDIEEEALQRLDELKNTDPMANPKVPYLTWSELLDSSGKRQIIEMGHSYAEGGSALSALFDPGPRFAGRLKEFQYHIDTLTKEKQPWTVVSRQSSRLEQLWRETHPDEASQSDAFQEGSLSGGWVLHLDKDTSHHLLTDSEIFGWSRPQPRRRPPLSSEAPEAVYADLKPGDYVVHVDHGIGRFIGLHKPNIDGNQREYLTIQYKDNDVLYVPIHQADRITRYIGPDSSAPHINSLGGTDWTQTKTKVRHAVVEVATDLLELYAKRQMASGYAFNPDTDWQRELEASFPYMETPDQLLAIEQVKADMESDRPMDRLLCGDVGYGKTEVALRAAFKAVADGKQVAVLVPTTVLAQQHYDTFRQRLSVFPVRVEMLSRFRTPKEQDQIIKDLIAKKVDIVIGTHRLVSGDVVFKDLGLVIIDEEQRFGVTHKEHLKKLREEVDVLTMTATPIPRTLYMALSGVRDISTINSPPEERLPVVTHIGPYSPKLVREAIVRELDRGGQVFFVHNRVQSISAVYNHLQNLVPEARIGIGHGQLPENELADVMHQFSSGQIDVLLSTSIIESGLDIPNANTLIVDRADTFGLSQLYQLRGRVGRGAQRAYAYLFQDKRRAPTPEGEERLEVLADNTSLGAGYSIAMRDLEMRGAGDLLGTRQSGYIAAVGFQMYTKLLSQAVQSLRSESGLADLDLGGQRWIQGPSLDVNVDLPLNSEIPSAYIPDEDLRLKLYRRISNLRTDEEIAQTEIEFHDRFGELPEGLRDLFFQMQVKLGAEEVGLESVTMVGQQILLTFPPLPQGIKERGLPDVDPLARVGKNAYWLNLKDLKGETWRDALIRILHKLKNLRR